ncbi:MAG: hypothetical protein WBD15_16280, partial [Pseudolabrys sp.]
KDNNGNSRNCECPAHERLLSRMSPHHPSTDAPIGFVSNLTLVVAILPMRAAVARYGDTSHDRSGGADNSF